MRDYEEIERCRICRGYRLTQILELGTQALTGVFPYSTEEVVKRGPLTLMWCADCGLVQLAHSFDASEMYGSSYGYRSGLNQSMVQHLADKVRRLERRMELRPDDVIVDIGSNDCTTLKAYTTSGLRRIGIDPTGHKFRAYYPSEVTLIPDFFSAEKIRDVEQKKARIVTSIAMFYDLEDPIEFASQVADILEDDGIWHFEQSYLPSMLRNGAYDTVCHEHLEYYSLSTVKYILDHVGMQILDVEMNAVNGGSFAVTAGKLPNKETPLVGWLLDRERRAKLHTQEPYRAFSDRVYRHRDELRRLLDILTTGGKRVLGYGASTKGNVVLQFCGISPEFLPAIAEVNEEKFGAFTPGTYIPIIADADARASLPDYFLVLPWHFREGIIRREKEFLEHGGKFIFPFPEIEVV